MSTYVMSDIHGALRELRIMLAKTGFRYDGTDTLYLLGDYADWGAEPVETLRYVYELDRKWDFVHCLIGNHETMFLETLEEKDTDPDTDGPAAENWFQNNRGERTYREYRSLPAEEQRKLRDWMEHLPYSAETSVAGKTYLMAHAYPYYGACADPHEEDRHRTDAVWRRLMIRENPFGFYEGPKHYDIFLCGHTITEYYFHRLRYEHDWPFRKPETYVYNRIFHGERFIDLDCGAKCLSCTEESSPGLRRAASRAQLSCLRLDDMHEFYVHPVKHRVPEAVKELLPEDSGLKQDLHFGDHSPLSVRAADVQRAVFPESGVKATQMTFDMLYDRLQKWSGGTDDNG